MKINVKTEIKGLFITIFNDGGSERERERLKIELPTEKWERNKTLANANFPAAE